MAGASLHEANRGPESSRCRALQPFHDGMSSRHFSRLIIIVYVGHGKTRNQHEQEFLALFNLTSYPEVETFSTCRLCQKIHVKLTLKFKCWIVEKIQFLVELQFENWKYRFVSWKTASCSCAIELCYKIHANVCNEICQMIPMNMNRRIFPAHD